MIQKTHASLKELQRLDDEIAHAEQRADRFAPLLEEVEAPVAELEKELESTQSRLQEMRLDERRLERAADDKRTRMKKLQERMNTVRNLREEAAVHAELELIRRTLEADEQEALGLLDQIRKVELRMDELQEKLEGARAEVGPRKDELLREHEEVERGLGELRERRERFAMGVDSGERKLYDAIKQGRRVAVAELTPDGACGHCFSMVPLQIQNEIRRGDHTLRCEGCGVILIAGEEGEVG